MWCTQQRPLPPKLPRHAGQVQGILDQSASVPCRCWTEFGLDEVVGMSVADFSNRANRARATGARHGALEVHCAGDRAPFMVQAQS